MWKKYKDFNIEVNEKGEIRNAKTKRIRKQSEVKNRNDNEKGYKMVGLHKDGKQKNHYVHRLVAELFIPNPNNYPCVNHIDNNRQNNNVNNLEWCSFQHNTRTAFREQNAFKKYVCVCCGKEFFDLGQKDNTCSKCRQKQDQAKVSKIKKQKRIENRKEFIKTALKNELFYYYYYCHKKVFDKWAKGKTLEQIAKTEKCSKQNIWSLVKRLQLYAI